MIETYTPSLKDKLRALIGVFLDDSKFDPIMKKVIGNLATNFLKNASDEDIKEAVQKLRNDVIPFILGEEGCNCMTYNIPGPHHKEDCPLYENSHSQQ